MKNKHTFPQTFQKAAKKKYDLFDVSSFLILNVRCLLTPQMYKIIFFFYARNLSFFWKKHKFLHIHDNARIYWFSDHYQLTLFHFSFDEIAILTHINCNVSIIKI